MSYRFPVIRRRGEKILPAFSPAGTIFQVISGERDAGSSGCNESELSRGDREIEGVTRIDFSQARETRSRSRNPLRHPRCLPRALCCIVSRGNSRDTREGVISQLRPRVALLVFSDNDVTSSRDLAREVGNYRLARRFRDAMRISIFN